MGWNVWSWALSLQVADPGFFTCGLGCCFSVYNMGDGMRSQSFCFRQGSTNNQTNNIYSVKELTQGHMELS
jgi:hypothetical protein